MTLTDAAEDSRWPGKSARLLANVAANARRNGIDAATAPLDWEACEADEYAPAERFARIIGSDVVYSESMAGAYAYNLQLVACSL